METENNSTVGVGALETATADKIGRLGIPYLHRYWERHGPPNIGALAMPVEDTGEWDLENTLLSGLGLNLLETSRFLHGTDRPGFGAFEDWILELNGGAIEKDRLTRLQEALVGKGVGSTAGCLDEVPGLTAEELAHWDQYGYLVVHDVVDAGNRDAAATAIYEFLEADAGDADTWYGSKYGKTIWVPLLRHAAFLANRRSPRLVKAFAQLWGREDLWSTVDQGGFNPPERDGWRFPGPNVHWDMTLSKPHCFGVQGILYLTDTPAEQGAFCCIPGFHRVLEEWLRELPPGENPRKAVTQHRGYTPIAGNAGDLVIWHQFLPHGSCPNRGARPRVAQYITLRPTRWAYTPDWT
jgi:hypothetical protein